MHRPSRPSVHLRPSRASRGHAVALILAVLAAVGIAPPDATVSAATYVEGIDVSHWQDTIDWSHVYAAGKRFAIIKATQGTTFLDSQYATNHAGARAAGIRTTAYHFASPDASAGDAVKEADWFVANARLLPGDLMPALDLEQSGGLGTSALQNWVNAWLGEVSRKLGGVKAMIYTSPAFWKKYVGDTSLFADRGYSILWVAHWFVSLPTVPGSNWGGKGWTFWQYDDCGSVPGIGGCVDLDRYRTSDMTAVTYQPNFSLSASPSSTTVKQGSTASMTVKITRKYFTLPIDLSVSGLPDGTAATITPATAPGASATLAITTSKTGTITPVGKYPLTITGVNDTYSRTATATLTVADGIAPVAAAPISRLYFGTTLGSTTVPVRLSWSATDEGGIGSYGLHRRQNSGSWTTVALSTATSTSTTSAVAPRATYEFRTRAIDRAGNVSTWVEGVPFIVSVHEQTSSLVHYSGSWPSQSNSAASGDHLRYATAKNASATFSFTGSSVAWVAYRGPTRGSAAVYIDGAYKATINLHTTHDQARPIAYAWNWATNGQHTMKIVCLGTSGHPRVDVDAFVRVAQVP